MENHARAQLHATPRGGAGGDQSRRSGSTSEDWGWRGGTGGEPGPMDIEVARRRSHEPTAVRAGARTRMAGIYSTLDRHNMLGRITRLPLWSRRDVLAGARLDRVDGGGSRCNGPTRSRSQDVTVGGWVTIRGRQTTLTDLLGGRFCTLPL